MVSEVGLQLSDAKMDNKFQIFSSRDSDGDVRQTKREPTSPDKQPLSQQVWQSSPPFPIAAMKQQEQSEQAGEQLLLQELERQAQQLALEQQQIARVQQFPLHTDYFGQQQMQVKQMQENLLHQRVEQLRLHQQLRL